MDGQRRIRWIIETALWLKGLYLALFSVRLDIRVSGNRPRTKANIRYPAAYQSQYPYIGIRYPASYQIQHQHISGIMQRIKISIRISGRVSNSVSVCTVSQARFLYAIFIVLYGNTIKLAHSWTPLILVGDFLKPTGTAEPGGEEKYQRYKKSILILKIFIFIK